MDCFRNISPESTSLYLFKAVLLKNRVQARTYLDGGGQVLALSVNDKLPKCNQRCPDVSRVWGTWVHVIHLNTQWIGSYGVRLVSSSPRASAQIQAETSSHPGWLKTPVGLKTNENLPQVQREVLVSYLHRQNQHETLLIWYANLLIPF